jgi:hypothetical protein
LAKHLGCKFIETSSKQRINVDEAFSQLVREIRKYNRVCESDHFTFLSSLYFYLLKERSPNAEPQRIRNSKKVGSKVLKLGELELELARKEVALQVKEWDLEVKSKALKLKEAELARTEAELQAKAQNLERREEVRRKEMVPQSQTRAIEHLPEILVNLHQRVKEVEPLYQQDIEWEPGPPQRIAIIPDDAITLEPADTFKDVILGGAAAEKPTSTSAVIPLSIDASKGNQGQFCISSSVEPRSCPEAAASTIAFSLPNPRAEETIMSTPATDTVTTCLSGLTDLAVSSSSAAFNESRADVRSMRSSLSTWHSGYVPSIFSDTSASQGGFRNACYSPLEREQVALLIRHQRQWDALETAKSLTWDMFPWPVLKRVASEHDILPYEVEVYLAFTYGLENMPQAMEHHIVENMHRWDINWMEAKVFGRVHDNDLEKVKCCVIRVAGILTKILDAILK